MMMKISCGLTGFCVMTVSVSAVVFAGRRPMAALTARAVLPLEIHSSGISTATSSGKADANADDDRKKNRRMVKIGIYVVCGIGAVGLAVIFFAVTWGRIARNRGRLHTPSTKTFDPLWYLKKLPVADESSKKDTQPPRRDDDDDERTEDEEEWGT